MEPQAMLVQMGRKKVIETSVLVRLLPGQREAIEAALSPGEKLAVFLRAAIAAELERRGKRKKRK
jgi:hypothetical protein